MKKTMLILTAIFASAFLISCDRNGDLPIVKKELISAKWNLTSDDYKSFEFNMDGNYIAVKNTDTKAKSNESVFFGTYEITDDITVTLSDFGTLKIIRYC